MGITLIPPAPTNQVRLRYTLTSSGTLSIPGVSVNNPITATVVCVGGGAGGGSGYGTNTATNWWNPPWAACMAGGPGGMGGSVILGTTVITGDVPYVVGAGGTGGSATTQSQTGGAGGDTYFANVYAPGGKSLYIVNNDIYWGYNQIPVSVAAYINNYTSSNEMANGSPASANSIAGPSFAPDGGYRRNFFNRVGESAVLTWANLAIFAQSFGASGTGVQGNSSTGQGALSGQAGTNGGTAGGGTAAVAAMSGGTALAWGAAGASTTWAVFANTPLMLLHAGGGGGSGGSGRSDGGAARAGGSGGAGTTYGGAGGAGGNGGTASGASTAAGSAGSNATGIGAGGGGGGGAANGNTNSSTSTNGGAGGNGSPGAIYIYY